MTKSVATSLRIFFAIAVMGVAMAQATSPLDIGKIDRERILRDAATALSLEPITITAYRAKASDGGSNDYYSNGDYWWPNPDTATGLPYIRRDGRANPGNFNYHRACINQLHGAVAALGAAYKITGEDRHVAKAVMLLQVFFLDPRTRMNPTLNYAQAIPGVSPGRSTGIIDTLHLVEIPPAIEAMSHSAAFPPDVLAGMKAWFSNYLAWMMTSRNGMEEANAGNNHAVAFWLQAAVFSKFINDQARLTECRRRFKEVFIAKQMAGDASFPRELERTKPYGYSIFQLDNMAALCQTLTTANDDLWKFDLPDGRCMRKAMAYLYPFLADKTKWPLKPDVEAWEGWPVRQPSLLFSGIAFNEQKYLDLWKKLPADPVSSEVRRNMAISQPVLWLRDLIEPAADEAPSKPEIRTPPPPRAPRINGSGIFGVRPGHPFLYHIPATGDRPMEFSAKNLPGGLKLDPAMGEITGAVRDRGEYIVTLQAHNAFGTARKKFKIVAGETIALTPPMGWNSWNHYAGRVSQEVVLQMARAMVKSGLVNHGWTYVNIDDSWQGSRGRPFNAIQGNDKFPDMKQMCDGVHSLGLKIGIYSTPWITSYVGYIGGSAENPAGSWTKPVGKKNVNKKIPPWAVGRYHFATNDAKQWAEWGVDYLKYDWNPIEPPETVEMAAALTQSGRDIIFSLSNNLNITNAPAISPLANSWRTTGDIKANWKSMSDRGFGQDKWRRFSGPGHWNDPDMLEIATREKNQPGLTPDEEYTHMTIWCLDSAPLLLGNDLSAMDSFTLNLLENDEVLAVDQDSLGDQALCISKTGDTRAYSKKLRDGSLALGLFNMGTNGVERVTVKFSDLQIQSKRRVRDLWRQKDLGTFKGEFSMRVAPHGAELVKIGP